MIFNNEELNFSFERAAIILGSNNSGKTYLINTLVKGFEGNLDDFQINNLKVYKGDYKVILLNDEMNFETEFKFSKTNELKKIICDEIIEKYINEKGSEEIILESLNETFLQIGNDINKWLEENINCNINNNVNFSLKFDNIDKIIERFAEIYINDATLKEKKSPKSLLREILFYLLIILSEKTGYDNTIFLIDNIECYLATELLIKFINIINQITEKNPNIKFIITSSDSNLYKVVQEKFDVYKIYNNKLYKLNKIDNIIKNTIILNEYLILNDNEISLNSFFEQNEHLIIEEDITIFKNKHYYPNLEKIGILYTSNNCQILKEYNNENNKNYIIATSEQEKNFFKLIAKELVVDTNEII